MTFLVIWSLRRPLGNSVPRNFHITIGWHGARSAVASIIVSWSTGDRPICLDPARVFKLELGHNETDRHQYLVFSKVPPWTNGFSAS